MITYQTKVPVSIDALQSFERSRLQAIFSRAVGRITRKKTSLLDLGAVTCRCGQPDRHYGGIQTVPVGMIRGSEGRSDDFDRNFNPLHTRIRQRWMRIYTAWWGEGLPPVDLVQVGDEYYVRDGHHRISVAHALGNDFIDAEVTVLESPRCPLNSPVN